MTERPLPPPVTGTEMRLDRLIGRFETLITLLTPDPAVAGAPKDGEQIELREPETVNVTRYSSVARPETITLREPAKSKAAKRGA